MLDLPRVLVDGVMQRLVRYSGTKPPSLGSLPVLYAADVLALAGGV